jgi:hypothetical protein
MAGPHRIYPAAAILLLAALLLGLFASLALGAPATPLSRSHIGTVTASAIRTGSISGKVTDSHGVGLADVLVEVLLDVRVLPLLVREA